MLKATTFIVAAFALSAQAAMAGPLGGSITATEAGEKSEKSLVSSVMEQLKFSISTIRGTAGSSGGESSDYKSSPKQQCDETEKSADEKEDAGTEKKAQPVGPEPIYFGF